MAVYLVLAVLGLAKIDAALAVVLVFGAIFSYGGVYIFKKGYRNGFVMKMLRGIGRLPGLHRWSQRMEDKYGEAIGNIDKQISQLRQQNKSVFRKSFTIETDIIINLHPPKYGIAIQ